MEILTKNVFLDRTAEEPLYRQVENFLESYIREGNLQLGQAIPSPRILSKQLDVNELTIRKAVRNMVQRRLLVTHHGRGTFVTSDALQKKILVVCGVDMNVNDVSPFYFHFIQMCSQELSKLGFTAEPVWLSSLRCQDAEPYCNTGSFRKYLGYVFIGCRLDHCLLEYVARKKAYYVVVGHNCPHPHVVLDRVDAIKVGMKNLENRQHKRITVMYLDDQQTNLLTSPIFSSGMDIQLVPIPVRKGVSQIVAESYRRTCELIEKKQLGTGVLFTDGNITQGASRAILKCCGLQERNYDLVSLNAPGEVIPLGLPVNYLTFDDGEFVHEAVKILINQIEGHTEGSNFFVGKFHFSDQIKGLEYFEKAECASTRCEIGEGPK